MKLPLEILRDENAPVIALLYAVINKYSTSCFSVDPAFLRDMIESDYNITLSDLQSDKIQCGIRILSTDAFENQWEMFNVSCHLLNNTPVEFETYSQLEAEELATALAHYKLLIGDDEEKAKFSDEVKAFAGMIFYNYGMSKAPNIFPTAIMPECVEADPTEKNIALNEIYNAKENQIRDYMSKIVK